MKNIDRRIWDSLLVERQRIDSSKETSMETYLSKIIWRADSYSVDCIVWYLHHYMCNVQYDDVIL